MAESLAKPLPSRRVVVAWCLFDFANSAYTTLIITLVFSVYFREAVVGGPGNEGDRAWGLANFIAMAIVALISPVIGAIADHSGGRRRWLVGLTGLSIAATGLLYSVTPGRVVWGTFLYVLGTVGFEAGYVFYNSFLPDVSTPRTVGRVSGWAWAIGFLGGLAALLICFPLIGSDLRDPGGALSAGAVHDRRLSFVVTAVFFLVFALPAFVWLRDRTCSEPTSTPGNWIGIGIRRVVTTLRTLRQHRNVGLFILASLFFTDGITTVIAFSAIFAVTTHGFTSSEVRWLFLVLNLVAFPGALCAGYLADVAGARRTLIGTIWLWCGVVILAAFASGKSTFWVAACGAAIGMGATQAVGRSFMAQLCPPDRAAEFFGFYVQSGKLASMFGPLIFGLVSASSGSQRLAVLSLLPFFVIGLSLLYLVRTDDRARCMP